MARPGEDPRLPIEKEMDEFVTHALAPERYGEIDGKIRDPALFGYQSQFHCWKGGAKIRAAFLETPHFDHSLESWVSWKIWKGRRPRYRFGGRVNVSCSGNIYSETTPTNVITYQAISEGVTLQGAKDPRGTTGRYGTHKCRPRCSHPPLGGLTT
jgi:hypothetical protein